MVDDVKGGDPAAVRHLRPDAMPPAQTWIDTHEIPNGTEPPENEADDTEWLAALERLRAPFLEEQIEKLPKPTRKGAWDGHSASECPVCGGYHVIANSIHLDYVGHAGVTNRLLEVDPLWSWEPMAYTEAGTPLFSDGGLWIRLTICGVTRIGFGDGASVKEVIGDCLLRGTPVLTDRGWRPIETVEVGQSVPTRTGWRAVTDRWRSHLAAPVQAVLLDSGNVLVATPNHRIPTERGVVYVRDLRNGDMLFGAALSVRNAGRRFGPPNHGADSAHPSVVAVLDAGVGEVWNLSVEGEHEYIANGVVVHNSIRNAAMRFGVALDLWSKADLHAGRNPDNGPTQDSRGGGSGQRGGDQNVGGAQRGDGSKGRTSEAGGQTAPAPNQDALDSLASVCDEHGYDRRAMRGLYEEWVKKNDRKATDISVAAPKDIIDFAAHLIETATPDPDAGAAPGAVADTAKQTATDAVADEVDTSDVEKKPGDLF